MVTAYIGLGSNLGDRQSNLDQALQVLQEEPGFVVNQVSSYYEYEAEGGPPGQPDYLNAAAEVETDLTPDELLKVLQKVENSLGRVRRERHGPRTLDLDLLLYGDLVRDDAVLTVPHPRLHERGFVLEPLAEIAPTAVHPKLHKTISQLWEEYDPEAAEEAEKENEEAIQAEQPQGAAAPAPARRPAGRELAGLKALITGSTRGIGRAIAVELAAAGAEVIVHGRNSDAGEAVAAEIEGLGAEPRLVLADLGELDECRRLVQEVWTDWGPLDIWVNNAGADILTSEAAEWPFAQKLQALLDVDVMATMLLARDVGRRMKAEGRGVILNMGWDQAETGMDTDSGQLFAATKAAVMAFTKSLALALAPQVRVNCLAPGWIQTSWGSGASKRWQERVRRETPLGRWGTPEDVAATARWLVSPAAAFVTGQVVRVNGGAVR
jgi:2-amino-4-hydroxy-6-hydroxymethyldihydropteridine diphosphokinase